MTFFDTAEVYGPFTDEVLVGEALAPCKGREAIASKFGFAYQGSSITGRDARPQSIRAADRSVRRIRDHVCTEVSAFRMYSVGYTLAP